MSLCDQLREMMRAYMLQVGGTIFINPNSDVSVLSSVDISVVEMDSGSISTILHHNTRAIADTINPIQNSLTKLEAECMHHFLNF